MPEGSGQAECQPSKTGRAPDGDQPGGGPAKEDPEEGGFTGDPAMALDFLAGCAGGVAGVLVGHPFDTVKVSLIAVLSSGRGGGADIGGRLAGLGRRDTPFW